MPTTQVLKLGNKKRGNKIWIKRTVEEFQKCIEYLMIKYHVPKKTIVNESE